MTRFQVGSSYRANNGEVFKVYRRNGQMLYVTLGYDNLQPVHIGTHGLFRNKRETAIILSFPGEVIKLDARNEVRP